jgi:hypothetical protein
VRLASIDGMRSKISMVAVLAWSASLLVGGCGGDEFVVTPLYDPTTTRAQVELSRGLEGSEQLHMRVRLLTSPVA